MTGAEPSGPRSGPGTLHAARALRTVAIDGPAGAGKSTLARLLANQLQLDRLDTGAMYRAATWAALDRGLDPGDAAAIPAILARIAIEVVGDRVTVDGRDVTAEIRTPAVDSAVSLTAAIPEVRRDLVARQRRWVDAHGGGVVEGRDIGTVVLPDADLKVFLTAAGEERARRRAAEQAGVAVDDVARRLEHRDRLDSSRDVDPLVLSGAADAVVVDSTGKPADVVLREVLDACR